MKKFNELTPADFPGYDALKVTDWLLAVSKAQENFNLFLIFLVVGFVICLFAFQILVAPGFVLLIIAQALINQKPRKLEKELKITRQIVLLARRGQLLDPAKMPIDTLPGKIALFSAGKFWKCAKCNKLNAAENEYCYSCQGNKAAVALRSDN